MSLTWQALRPRLTRRPLLSTLPSGRAALAAVILFACVDGPTGPGNQPPATLSVQVELPEGTPEIWFPRGDSLRLSVRRAGRVAPVVNTGLVVGDVLGATVTVPMATAIERFVLTAEVVVEGQVLFLAFEAIQLLAAQDTTITLRATYVGPGAAAAEVSLAPDELSIARGDTSRLSVTVLDSLGRDMGRVPVRFLAARESLVTVDGLGLATALPDAESDTARILVYLPMGLSASALVRVGGGGGGPVTTELVAFIRETAGNRDVWIMNEDGTGARPVTATPADDELPAWSPDRSRIAFSRLVDEGNGVYQVFTIGSDGRDERQLTTTGSNRGPRWSPDGTRIAFTRVTDDRSEVWVMNADGSSQRRLVDPRAEHHTLADWSPDGRQVLVITRRTRNNPTQLAVFDVATGVEGGPLACDCGEGGSGDVLSGRWSPMGGVILFAGVTRLGNDRVGTITLDPAIPSPLGGFVYSPESDVNPSFARAEDVIVFESLGAVEGQQRGIYRRDASGTIVRLSAANVIDLHPDFAFPMAPMYVDRVVVSPPTASLFSDGSRRQFTAAVTTVNGTPVATPVEWRIPEDGRIFPTANPGEVQAFAPGPTRIVASYRGWRVDTAEITVATATGPSSRLLAASVNGDIWTLRGDGSDARPLITDDEFRLDRHPAWSPDGSRIAWTSYVGGDGNIWRANADGSGRVRLTTNVEQDQIPSWSPDGRWIVHTADRSNLNELWIMDSDGGNLRRLTSPPRPGDDVDAAWSPDGTLIAFTRQTAGGAQLMVVPALGGTPTSLGSGRYPAWSTDGTTLYYSDGQPSRIYSRAYPIGTPVALTTGGDGAVRGDFKPTTPMDGLLLFWSVRFHPYGQQVIARVDGSAVSGLVPFAGLEPDTRFESFDGVWRPSAPPRFVASVDIGGELSPLAIGATRQLSASARDQSGAAITPLGPFSWISLDPALATVDGTGLVRAVSAGSARIVLAIGVAAPDTVTLTVSAPVTAVRRTWVGGAAGAPTGWHVAQNWSPVGVPDVVDTVVISTATNQPTLTANAEVTQVTVIGGGNLTLGGYTLRVRANFATGHGGGTLTMRHPADTLDVGRNVEFAGAPLDDGRLTAGVLRLGGDFLQNYVGSNWESFQASGTHRTVFAGNGTQTVRFQNPGAAGQSSFFHHLVVDKPSGSLVLLTNATANGTLRLASGPIEGAGTITVGDTLRTLPGTSMMPGGVRLRGAMAVAGLFAPQYTEFFGVDQRIQGGLGYRNVRVVGQATLAGAATFDGTLGIGRIVNGIIGDLDIGGYTLIVTGDFATEAGGGTLTMRHSTSAMRVGGNALFAGNSAPEKLSAGTLFIAGDVRQAYVGSNHDAVQASGSHLTVLDGTGTQTLRFDNPGRSGQSSFFHHLRLDKLSGAVTLATDAVANGSLTIARGTLDGPGTLTVGDSLVTAVGTTVVAGGIRIGGGMAVAGTFSPLLTEFFGVGQRIQGGLGYRNVRVVGQARLDGDATFGGTFGIGRIVNGIIGDFDLGGHTLRVQGDFATEPGGGTLSMHDAADSMHVMGNALFAGDAAPGRLTAGTLVVEGDVRQQYIGSNFEAVQASGTHRTILAGSRPQTLRFDNPGRSGQRSFFHHLTIDKSSGAVSLATDAVANGRLRITRGTLDGAGTLTVGDSVITALGTDVVAGGIRIGGGMAVAGTFSPLLTEFFGVGQRIQGGLAYRNLRVVGTATLDGDVVATGTVGIGYVPNVMRGDLDLGGHSLVVGGNFATESSGGTLTMRHPADSLDVAGNVEFAGAPLDGGHLTAGTLRFQGNFFQNYVGSNWESFQASGTHRTVLAGNSTQTITFQSPGRSGQSSFFNVLEIDKPGGNVVLATNAFANGTLVARRRPIVTITGLGRLLTVGGVAVDGLVLDSVALSIGAGTLAQFDSVTFRRQLWSGTQLTIAHPGAAATFRRIVFETEPTTGYYVSATDTAPTNGVPLAITLLDPEPTNGSAATRTAGGATVTWTSTRLRALR